MLKILVVDDEAAIRSVVKDILTEHFNCWVDVANNAASGLASFKRKKYDIVFLDFLFLGGADGLNLLFEMKRWEPSCVTVLMSGFLRNEEHMRNKSLGITPDEFLQKPFTQDDIVRIMSNYFSDIQLQRHPDNDNNS